MDLSLTTTVAAATTIVAATAAYMMQHRPKGFTEEELAAEDENANQIKANASNANNKRAASTSPKKADEPTVSAKKSAKKAKADKKKKQKAKKATKKAAQATITIDSAPQKALDLTTADADAPAEEGWEVVVDKKPKAKLPPAVAALLRRKSLEVDSTAKPTTALPASATPADTITAAATTATIKIAVAKIGHVVGINGKTITAIRMLTGCTISIPDRETITGVSVDVTVTGEDAHEVSAAKKIVADLTSKGYSAQLEGALSGGDFCEAQVKVPVASLHEVIGKGGAIIQAVQSKLGVKLSVPDTSKGNVGKKVVKVTVAGPKDGVAKAKEVVKSLVVHHYHALTHPGTTHCEVDVPEAMYSIVIGPRGSSIKHIQNSYLVKVHIPRDGDGSAVTVIGSAGRVKQAKKHILSMVANANAEQEAQADWGYGEAEPEHHERHEAWMDQYAPPRRTTGAQWA